MKKFKRNVMFVVATVLVAVLAMVMCACGNKTNNGDSTIPDSSQGDGKKPTVEPPKPDVPQGDDNKPTVEPPKEVLPTAQEIVAARAAVTDEQIQGYDFALKLSGELSIAGYPAVANANYDGSFRVDKNTGEYFFKRKTGGILLYDSEEYIYNNGAAKIKLVMDGNTVKKAYAVAQADEDLMLVNLPFVGIVDALTSKNISDIKKETGTNFKYSAKLSLSSDNAIVQKALSTIANLGTSLEMGDVSFTNIINGVRLFFNIANGRMQDFSFAMEVSFPVLGQNVKLTLSYAQTENKTQLAIPKADGIITDERAIKTEIDKIYSALNKLKTANTYSLDVEAKNEFDPGWSKRAIVDKYISRLYKNTTDGRVDFNNSYEYKAHTEEEGAETFKYTIANISKDGSVHKVSRKGKNVITPVEGVTVDTQFDYLISAVTVLSQNVDCIRKTTEGGTVKYYVYVNSTQALSVQSTITELINSNDAEGVIKADNHFNYQKNMIRDAEMIVEMKGDAIVSIQMETKIKYNPTGGEYTENRVTLTDSIVLKVNAKLDKATEYVAPKNTETSLGSYGLNNAKFYIL